MACKGNLDRPIGMKCGRPKGLELLTAGFVVLNVQNWPA
jgi:hypothetical protein